MSSRANESRGLGVTVVVVGDELLWPGCREGHTDWLIAQLARMEIAVVAALRIRDEVDGISDALDRARQHSSAVVMTGGLGPTEDDRTRYGIAQFLDCAVAFDRDAFGIMQRQRGKRTEPSDEALRSQAMLPEGCRWLANAVGSAAGLEIENEGLHIFALPGVPGEMRRMFEEQVKPRLRTANVGQGHGGTSKLFRICGLGESAVDERLKDLYPVASRVTILIGLESIECHVQLESGSNQMDELERQFRERLGDDFLGTDHETLPVVVGRLLKDRDWTLATAESCTGGMIGAALTDVPGSSAWYRGGVVVYNDELKTDLLGVPGALLKRHGAVSEPVVRAMAAGLLRAIRADVGVAISGIAGPGGAVAGKPVGAVCGAVALGDTIESFSMQFPGDRERVRQRSVAASLDAVRRRLLHEKPLQSQ